MSPEQLEGKEADARSDIFAFGAVLYEMLSGQRAFQGDSTVSMITAVTRDAPKALREFVKDLPPEWNVSFCGACARRPKNGLRRLGS
jgi:serine/threonine-protein kinase